MVVVPSTASGMTIDGITKGIDAGIIDIKSKTDNLPLSPANEDSVSALSDDLAVIEDLLDTEIGEIITALTSAISEPSAGAPTATPTIRQAIAYLYANWRNEKTQTATAEVLKNNAGTPIAQRTVTEDGTTLVSGKMGAPS
jgi:hypothetical protein